ncbi:bifunctional 3'-5' exonuclease/DNA polymerase [Microbacterium sp. zg-Y818]|uniref:bifunctional 3'-5' exonuclease/DNA polymerase n=1 Tax=unclassified Microbacterium TaxID=2609290 RepID=UPI00214B2098|nr:MULTISPECIES: bifunctional 3'-5' exonuclease/DNA polymerase [unclassified Microbacterium]MCR2800912.1 bifunctional 3'-5' exonuclease/DNA polymerase [Microbacterium sp. zg.Y818]WIM23622.1 bifunctional 3'-5' exonuclease/DNA polymerase [Microbacterium sp. zg-Y818]
MPGAESSPTWIAVGRDGDGITAALLNDQGGETARVAVADLPSWVADAETAHAPRWVWSDTPTWYDGLLDAGVRVARCHDLRLCHAILRGSVYVTDSGPLRDAGEWDAAAPDPGDSPPTLFEFETASAPSLPQSLDAALAEFARQRAALAGATEAGRLRLLLAAESAGALVAAEMRAAGLPWDEAAHDGILTELLGPRPAAGSQPRELERAAAQVRAALGDPTAALDSQPKLLRSLHRVGVLATSTSKWELAQYDHPAIAPLLEYKRLARLLSANGWAWLDEWVHDGRFRPVYVPGGVVTGRWASSGGGALQLPRQLRDAVRADPGWVLVVADVAQLEPRVLAAMAGDVALAEAARGRDLYAGIVERGAVSTRSEAKFAMLGAMYGATTGDSGRLVPALRRTFPRAMALVDDAARTGEEGGIVATRLGRTSPPPSAVWRAAQGQAGDPEATGVDETRARRWARDRGRFTRNFVVQGTAAEWALAWLADLRGRLAALPAVPAHESASRSGPAFERRAHLAFFLHDEVIVHAPAAQADAAAHAVAEAAASAGRLLFGTFPIDFPLDVRIAQSAQKD